MYTAPPPLARYGDYPRLVLLGWVGLTLLSGCAFSVIAGLLNTHVLWQVLAGAGLRDSYASAALLGAALLIGTGVAAAQLAVLRLGPAGALGWLAASVVGSGISMVPWIAVLHIPLSTNPGLGLIAGALQGATLAAVQSLVLRRYYTHTRWWIAASLLAGAWRWELHSLVVTPLESLLVNLLGWLLVGGLTGTALVWIMRRREQSPVHGDENPHAAPLRVGTSAFGVDA